MSAAGRPTQPVLAGNSLAAVHVLELLLDAWPPDDVLVIAAPDRERAEWHPSLAEIARRHGVPTWQPARIRASEMIDALRQRGCDLLLSVYYTQVFPPELLSIIEGPALNFHPSLLPRHRGVAPLIWAIAEGDTMTGVSIHQLTTGIDTGPLVDQALLPIHPDDTGFVLHQKAALLVRGLAARLLRRLAAGQGLPDAKEQSGPASYHAKGDGHLNHIDWSASAARIRDVVRALAPPLPGAYAIVGDRRVVIEEVAPLETDSQLRPPGLVEIRGPSRELVVWAGDRPVLVKRVRDGAVSVTGTALVDALSVRDGECAR